MSLLNDYARCYGASSLDWRWEANCATCLRRTAAQASETSAILPPLILDEIKVCPQRVVGQSEEGA